MRTCPTCNRPLVSIDTDQLEALAALNMPRKERVILNELLRVFPRRVALGALVYDLWEGLGEPEVDNPLATIQAMVSKLRRKIKPLGWGLRNERYLGYKLVRL